MTVRRGTVSLTYVVFWIIRGDVDEILRRENGELCVTERWRIEQNPHTHSPQTSRSTSANGHDQTHRGRHGASQIVVSQVQVGKRVTEMVVNLQKQMGA